ncbi:hypothetical protein NP233_g10086 [Leucocoprinus birnbaumii]|uniref:Uncharacterized protein n=1 Tax=Leucocoprinus birnbaumii TaxID=56174 RepID=A0AAD5VMM5_9AGAR|nr:hypothetical protein NP233_g10086 [Leucocoprinus birnbaumii]
MEDYCRQQFSIPPTTARKNYAPYIPRYRKRWNWKSTFAKVRSSQIKKQMRTHRTIDAGKGINNMTSYHRAKQHVLKTATAGDKDYFGEMADQANRKKRSAPTLMEVLSQQDEILSTMYDQLDDCLGWEPGQFGNGLCLLAVAVRGNDGRVKADATLVSNPAVPDNHARFDALYTRYNKDMKSIFELVANELLPLHTQTVDINPDLFLGTRGAVFPVLDVELMSLLQSRKLLRQFITFVWEQSGSEHRPRLKHDLPWTDLDSEVGRKRLLVNSEPFKGLSSFDPDKMTATDLKATVRSIGGVPNILAFIPEARVQINDRSSDTDTLPSSVEVSEHQAGELLSTNPSPSPSQNDAVEQPALGPSRPSSSSLIATADLTASDHPGSTTRPSHSYHDMPKDSSTSATSLLVLSPAVSAPFSREGSQDLLSSQGAYDTAASNNGPGRTDGLDAPFHSSESGVSLQGNDYHEMPGPNRKRKRSYSGHTPQANVTNKPDDLTGGANLRRSTRLRKWQDKVGNPSSPKQESTTIVHRTKPSEQRRRK